jgi:DNA-binding GntR family transcriptional regulator
LLLTHPKSLTELAARKLEEAILTGHLKPGERLREVELSSKLGISRAPFREAIRELAAAGLVEIRHNRGTYVASPNLDEMYHMVLMRAMIEGTAARLITLYRQPATFAKLRTISNKQEAAFARGDTRLVRTMHWNFHRTICEEAGNPYLLQAWASLSNLIQIYHTLNLDPKTVVRNNKTFLRTFEAGDALLAENLLRSQIIRMAYHYLGGTMTPVVQSFITHFIDENGEVHGRHERAES